MEWSLANLGAWGVQAAALILAGVWLPVRLRLGLPRARLLAFRALLVVLIALPLVQPWKVRPEPAAPADAAVELQLPASGPVATVPAGAAPSSPTILLAAWRHVADLSLARLALAILIAGALARLAWLALGLLGLGRLRRRSAPLADSPSILEAKRAVGTSAAFRQSARVPRPVTFGLRHPVVLVPPQFVDLEPSQQLAVACHELLHVRRQDWLRSLGDEAVRALLWFHPAVWWLVEQIHLAVEQLVDRDVVLLVGDRKSYLRALLVLAESGNVPRPRPVAAFLDRGHLRERVALLMEERSMSRFRVMSSAALVTAALVGGTWYTVHAFPLRGPTMRVEETLGSTPLGVLEAPSVVSSSGTQSQVGKPAPPPPPPPPLATALRPGTTTRWDEEALRRQIQSNPSDLNAYFALGRLYEQAGKRELATSTFETAARVAPGQPSVYMELAAHYYRLGDFGRSVAALERRATLDPGNPETPYTLAVYYWERAYRGAGLSEPQRREYIEQGFEQVNRALSLKPEYVEALTYKNLLYRQLALLETDEAKKADLIAQAEKLRAQALELRKQQGPPSFASNRNPYLAVDTAPPPPPPPPPSMKALRVGGQIRPPRKITDAAPVLPEVARSARVQGTVILDITINEEGIVRDVKLLRSIPLLDQAAVDAVKQWRYQPTLLNGTPVPVVMTVEVPFTVE
jgi:TonB family protein